MRLVVNTVLFNESENILFYLNNLRRIRDLWAVEILDGSWANGNTSNINSIDGTQDIIEEWKKSNAVPFEVNYQPSDEMWETESRKRNYLLEYTEGKYVDCWTLVLDADESIKFPTGRVGIFMKKILAKQTECGVVKAYPYNGINCLPSIRLIPTNLGVHYHTEIAMLLHDKDCNLLMDYNPTRIWQSRQTWNMDDFFIVNYWPIRGGNRQYDKFIYAEYQQKQDTTVECEWNK